MKINLLDFRFEISRSSLNENENKIIKQNISGSLKLAISHKLKQSLNNLESLIEMIHFVDSIICLADGE